MLDNYLLEDLLYNIDRHIKARADYNKKLAECEYDAGYFLAKERSVLDQSVVDIGNVLEKLIDDRVTEKLKERGL